jgi:type I restriction enzyme S subunit
MSNHKCFEVIKGRKQFKKSALGDIADFLYGYTATAKDTGNIRYIRITDIDEKGILKNYGLKYIEKDDLQEKYIVNKGDLLVARTGGTFGKTLFYKYDEPAVYASFLIKIILKNNYLLSDFYFHFSQSNHYWLQANNLVTGGGQPQFNANVLKDILVPIPNIPEQKAIANLLSTWDEAIDKIERLIQAKKQKFKWLCNEILYKPLLNETWEEFRMKSLFTERKETKRDDLPLLSITNNEGVIFRDETNRKDTSSSDKSKYLRICPGDIGYNTMRMWQGVSALSSIEGIVSPAYTICVPCKKLDPVFVSYLFKMPFMIHRFYNYSQGLTSDTWNLKFHHFCMVQMPLPPLAEQKQIIETLNIAQKEINLLKQLAEKYKLQKRGLMQKLLTGEWRVKC